MNMAKTYNGRFESPDEPKSGVGWLIGAGVFLMSSAATGIVGIAAMIACFVRYNKYSEERKLHRRFHEYCALIGARERVPLKDFTKVGGAGKVETRKHLQQMVARGFFGQGAYLDVNRDELVLPPVPGARAREEGGWRDVVFDILDALRGEKSAKPAAPKPEPKAEPKPEPKIEPKPEPKPEQTKAQSREQRKKNYMDELEHTLNELYQLNQQIDDGAVSQRIDRIGALTASIFRVVIEKPEREQDVRKFMNYYLPTTLKLLKAYELLEEQSYQGENIVASREKIESVLDALIEAYEKQLDRLFKDDALDIATDIDVLETMMAGDGLSAKGQMRVG